MALQSLDIGANSIRQELDIRTLAALPALRHLAVAGNAVMADMDPREQRVLVMDLMPGENGMWDPEKEGGGGLGMDRLPSAPTCCHDFVDVSLLFSLSAQQHHAMSSVCVCFQQRCIHNRQIRSRVRVPLQYTAALACSAHMAVVVAGITDNCASACTFTSSSAFYALHMYTPTTQCCDEDAV